MTFVPRVLVLSLAAFGAANLIASAALLWWWRRAGANPHALSVFAWRSIPAALSALLALLAGLALALFEPRGDETTGAVFLVFAMLGAACLLRMPVVAATGYLCTRRIVRRWTAGATPVTIPGTALPALAVTSAFPIVAVVGLWRPRLIIARSVVEACPAAELAAIAAHEEQHVSARHNICRAWLSALPDAVSWLPFADRIGEAWHLASEREADDAAAQTGATGRLDLASALIRVARLAPPGASPMDLPVSALFRGEPIEHRVRRLLDRGAQPFDTRPFRRALVMAVAGLAAALLNLRAIYEVLEAAVEHLP